MFLYLFFYKSVIHSRYVKNRPFVINTYDWLYFCFPNTFKHFPTIIVFLYFPNEFKHNQKYLPKVGVLEWITTHKLNRVHLTTMRLSTWGHVKLLHTEVVARRCSVKSIHENTCARVSLLINCRLRLVTLLKRALAQVLSCEIFKISKNTFFLQNTFGGYFCT